MTAFWFWPRRTDDQYVESMRKYRDGWGRKAVIVVAVAGTILGVVIAFYATSFLDRIIDTACSAVEMVGQLDAETMTQVVRPWMRNVALLGCFLGVCVASLAGCIGLLISSMSNRNSDLLIRYYDLALENGLLENEPEWES